MIIHTGKWSPQIKYLLNETRFFFFSSYFLFFVFFFILFYRTKNKARLKRMHTRVMRSSQSHYLHIIHSYPLTKFNFSFLYTNTSLITIIIIVVCLSVTYYTVQVITIHSNRFLKQLTRRYLKLHFFQFESLKDLLRVIR